MADIVITQLGGDTQVAEGGKTAAYTVKLSSAPLSPVTVRITSDDQALIANGKQITRHTVKVMPVGDSITYGVINSQSNTESGGYRTYLWKTLAAKGYRVNFVGSQVNGPVSIDRNHEGYRGRTIKRIADSVRHQLVRETPDVILLLAGTNDINRNLDLAKAPKRLATFVNQIFKTLPNAAVLVGTLPPNCRSSDDLQQIREFNSALRSLLNRPIRQGNAVRLVDLYSCLTTNDLTDQVHPKARGYRKIARSWYESLVEVLNSAAFTDLTRTQTLTFTPQNWDVAQTITVAATGDQDVEGVHRTTIRHTARSFDASYNNLSTNVTVLVQDNDPGILITPSDGMNRVEEGGKTDTYQIILTHKPTAPVFVDLTTNRQLRLSRSTLTFTPTNWRTPRTITVSAVDDAVIEGGHSSKITHSVRSRDVRYQIHDADRIVFNIVDNNGDVDHSASLPIGSKGRYSLTSSRAAKVKKQTLPQLSRSSSFNLDTSDRLLHVNQEKGDPSLGDPSLLSLRTDPITHYEHPTKLFNVGVKTGTTPEQAAESAYRDVNLHHKGNQALQVNQAVIFKHKTTVYLSINTYNAGFQAQHDPLIALGKIAQNNFALGNLHLAPLTVIDYFI